MQVSWVLLDGHQHGREREVRIGQRIGEANMSDSWIAFHPAIAGLPLFQID
jgi:hypothetical protein